MKKTIFAMAITALLSTSAMAQNDSVNNRPKRMDPTEMVQKRTEGTAKRYGLNEEQTAKLLELNKKYAKNMRPMRPMRPRGEGQPPRQGNDSVKQQRPNVRPQVNNDERRKKMEEEMTAYNKELQSIMTEEQYKSYQADMQKRMLRRPEGKKD